jgi:hypothetical protein
MIYTTAINSNAYTSSDISNILFLRNVLETARCQTLMKRQVQKIVKLEQCNESSWRCNIYGLFCLPFCKKDKYGSLIVLILLFFSCVSVSNAKTLDLM